MAIRKSTGTLIRRPALKLDTSIGEIAPIVFDTNGHWMKWTGTREQLIEAGLCKPGQFPEGRKRHKYAPGGKGERSTGLYAKARGLFEYWEWPTREERAEAEKRANECNPSFATPKAYREHLNMWIVWQPYQLLRQLAWKASKKIPFELDADDYNAIKDKLYEIQDILDEADIEDHRPPRVPEKQVLAAKHDGALQHFLNRIQGKELQ